MKVAAYQVPPLRSGSLEAVGLIRKRVEWCEAQGVAILCCPEVLGGLADDAADPTEFAIDAHGDGLSAALAPLASDTVTTILGFTEMTGTGRLYNTAAVFHKGSVVGSLNLGELLRIIEQGKTSVSADYTHRPHRVGRFNRCGTRNLTIRVFRVGVWRDQVDRR